MHGQDGTGLAAVGPWCAGHAHQQLVPPQELQNPVSLCCACASGPDGTTGPCSLRSVGRCSRREEAQAGFDKGW